MDKIISFCTCCKGRLWQLKQTLPHNIKYIEKNMEIVILDYQSEDGLKEYLSNNFKEELLTGKIKLVSLLIENRLNYSSAFAKNLCHRQSSGKILMNLDCDQFIDHNTIKDLKELPEDSLYIPLVTSKSTGQFGRLGYHRNLFYFIKGYNENLVGLKGDDSEMRVRTRSLGVRHTVASSYYPCIENTLEQKYENTDLAGHVYPNKNYPDTWGKVI